MLLLSVALAQVAPAAAPPVTRAAPPGRPARAAPREPASPTATRARRVDRLAPDGRYRRPTLPFEVEAPEPQAQGSEAPTMTLAQALELAYRTNPALNAERFETRAVDEGVARARAIARPSLELQLGGGYDRTVPGRTTQEARPVLDQALEPVIDRNDLNAQVVATQPLWTGGRATAAIRAAEGDVRAAREGLRVAEGDLLAQVVAAYGDVRRDAASVAIRRANVGALEATLDEIAARRVAGEATRTDEAQAQTQLAGARVILIQTEAQLESSRAGFAALVGAPPGVLAPEPALPLVPGSADAALQAAVDGNPDLAQAVEAERASRARVGAARAERSPTLSLRGTAGLTGEAVPFSPRDQDEGYTGRLLLTVPLFGGGRVSADIAEALDRNSADRFRIELARRQLVQNLLAAWNAYVANRRGVEIQLLQVEAARVFYDGSLQEYRQGLRSTFDVLFALNTLRDAQVGLLGSRRDLYVAQAALLRQTGRLEARALLTGTELYDPADNYRDTVRRSRLPWDGAVRALDRLGGVDDRQQPLERPAAPARAVAPAPAPPIDEAADPPLSSTDATTPRPGTTGVAPRGRDR